MLQSQNHVNQLLLDHIPWQYMIGFVKRHLCVCMCVGVCVWCVSVCVCVVCVCVVSVWCVCVCVCVCSIVSKWNHPVSPCPCMTSIIPLHCVISSLQPIHYLQE